MSSRDGQSPQAVTIPKGTGRDETYAVRKRGRSQSNEVVPTVLVLPVFRAQKQMYGELGMIETRVLSTKLGNMKMATQNFKEGARNMVVISDRITEDTAITWRIKEIIA